MMTVQRGCKTCKISWHICTYVRPRMPLISIFMPRLVHSNRSPGKGTGQNVSGPVLASSGFSAIARALLAVRRSALGTYASVLRLRQDLMATVQRQM